MPGRSVRSSSAGRASPPRGGQLDKRRRLTPVAHAADRRGMKALALPAARGAAFLVTGILLGAVSAVAWAATVVGVVADTLYGVRMTLLIVGVDFHPWGLSGDFF